MRLYATDPRYGRPPEQGIEAVFDPQRNEYFRPGEEGAGGETTRGGRPTSIPYPPYQNEYPTLTVMLRGRIGRTRLTALSAGVLPVAGFTVGLSMKA